MSALPTASTATTPPHRSHAAPPSVVDESHRYLIRPAVLPAEVQRAMIERTLRHAAQRGLRRIGVFPAGQHTTRLTRTLFTDCGVELIAVLDDARHGEVLGLPVQPTRSAPPLDAVLISSDSAEIALAARAAAWAGNAEILCVYDPLRREYNSTYESRRNTALARLAREQNGKINLGCGSHPLQGWTNIDGGDGQWFQAPNHPDVIHLDVFDALAALPDQSCHLMYSEHLYEHFTLDDGFKLAREWARVLKPGGIVRVVTPDLTQEARIYLGEQKPTDHGTYLRHKRRWLGERHRAETDRFLTPAMLLNFGMRLDGHRFIYDFETLQAQLEAAGFESVSRERFGESSRPELRGIDRHSGGETGGRWTHDIQLVVEGVRRRAHDDLTRS